MNALRTKLRDPIVATDLTQWLLWPLTEVREVLLHFLGWSQISSIGSGTRFPILARVPLIPVVLNRLIDLIAVSFRISNLATDLQLLFFLRIFARRICCQVVVLAIRRRLLLLRSLLLLRLYLLLVDFLILISHLSLSEWYPLAGGKVGLGYSGLVFVVGRSAGLAIFDQVIEADHPHDVPIEKV